MDPNGSSEWFMISAVVVRASNENAVGRWQREILTAFNHTQRSDIHYRKLSPVKRRLACQILSEKPVRLFVVMSNKKNMKGYRNPKCAQEKNYLYWWLTRLLLERVTRFCAKWSHTIYGGPRPIKMVFSQRGGMSYDRLISYLRLIRFQSEAGSLYLREGDLKWSVVDLQLIRAVAHLNEAGLQLADIVAGAFYEAVCMDGKRPCNPDGARLLIPRLYRGERGHALGYGVKPMPDPIKMRLQPQQRVLFESLGFPREKW